MRIRFLFVVFVSALVVFPHALRADTVPSDVVACGEIIPAYATTYSQPRSLVSVAPACRAACEASAQLSSSPTDGRQHQLLQDAPPARARSRTKYLPVLYSLILPGAGEIALGHYKRGAALLAVEAAAWTGYAMYNSRGLDGRADYEAFADRHWDESRWITNHRALEGVPSQLKTFSVLDSVGQNHWNGWPGYHTYARQDEEKQNYYENIGKYDWFISGWEDWDAIDQPMNTMLRDEYRSLRKESNDDLDTADRFIYLSIAARAFSLIETLLLVRGDNSDSQARSAKHYSFTARSTGLSSGELAFVYRFR